MSNHGKNYGKYDPVSKSNTKVCCITLNMADRLRFLACSTEVVSLIRQTVCEVWQAGIQKERNANGSHEFKLRGSPWHAQGELGMHVRKLLAAILTSMATIGWNLTQSTGVSKREGDKDSLFFVEGPADPDARIFAVSYNLSNRIRVIDAPDLFPCVLEAVGQFWGRGVDDQTEFDGCQELKLKGNPWYGVGEEAVLSKLLLCKIMANLSAIGFKLYASIDMSYGTEGQDLETWLFRRISKDVEYKAVPCKCKSASRGGQSDISEGEELEGESDVDDLNLEEQEGEGEEGEEDAGEEEGHEEGGEEEEQKEKGEEEEEEKEVKAEDGENEKNEEHEETAGAEGKEKENSEEEGGEEEAGEETEENKEDEVKGEEGDETKEKTKEDEVKNKD